VWSHHGRPEAVFHFSVAGGRITQIAVERDPAGLHCDEIVVLPA
jgi:hypothetical protein